MLQYEDFSLRTMTEGDLLQVLEWRNMDFIRSVMFNDRQISLDEHFGWYERVKQEPSFSLNIFEYKGRPLGFVNVSNIDYINKNCSWGFYLGYNDLPKGFGTIMGYLALEYIFERMGLLTVFSEVLDFNQRSLYFHQKLGFTVDGTKQKILNDGKEPEVICITLKRDYWLKIKVGLAVKCFKNEV